MELAQVLGTQKSKELGGRAARLIGLQYLQETMAMVGTSDGNNQDAAEYLQRMFEGMGDSTEIVTSDDLQIIELKHTDLRIVRGLEGERRDLVLYCWQQLWIGALSSYRAMKKLECCIDEEVIRWRISDIAN